MKILSSVAALATGLLTAAVLAAGGSVRAQETAPIQTYGALPAYDMVELSPSGDRIAYIRTDGEQRALLIHDLSDMNVIGGVRAGDVKVRDLTWIGETHVIVSTSATQSNAAIGLSRTELFEGKIYSIATRNVAQALTGTRGVVLHGRLAGSPIVRTVDGRGRLFVSGYTQRGRTLFEIDPDTGVGRPAEREAQAGGYLLNAAGERRARIEYDGDEWAIQTRRGDFWRTVWRTNARIDTPSLISQGQADNEVVVFGAPDGREEGFHILNLDTGAWSDVPYDGEGEIKDVIVHPSTRLLAGVVIGDDETLRRIYFDPDLERLWRSIRRAFPEGRVTINSISQDLRQIVVFTEGDHDAGTYHLVDLDRGLAEVIGARYALTADQVGEQRAISYAAADGMIIPGYLTLPPGVTDPHDLPLVVMPHGGPAARDTMGFDWWAQAMASRGYAVLQPNFRGSDGLGKAHLEAGYGEWGRKMQTDLSDGVRWLASEGIIDPARVCIVGASYGGYAAMAGPTLDPGVYRCAVAVAGVSDLRRMVSWTAEGGPRDQPVVRYWNRFMGAERLGDRSLDERSPYHLADRADAPILLLHGRDDTVVPFEQSRVMAEALARAGKPYELIELSGEDHWLSRGDTRFRMLTETIRFLETHNPPR